MTPEAQRWLPPEQKAATELRHSEELDWATIEGVREQLLRLRSELLSLRAELKFRQFLRSLKAGYRPDQFRDDHGRWTDEGVGSAARTRLADASARPSSGAIMSDASPDPIGVWAQYAQVGSDDKAEDPAIERTREVLHSTLARVNAAVSSQRDSLSAALYGIRVHTEFARDVRLQNLPGVGVDGVEQSFDSKGLARYGLDGSIRTDVVLRNDKQDIIAIYDVKTGNATMGPTRATEIRAYTRVGPDVPIIILHAVKPAWRR